MNSIIKLITISFIIICTFSPVNAGIYDGLVAWYPFDGNANDVSGNGNHGVVHGAKLTIDRFGISNSAYSFDGESDFITVLDSDSLDCISAFTISAWISQFEITSASQTIAAKGRAVNGTGYRLGIYDTGTDLGLNNGSYNCSAIASHTINNTWINITGTWDGKIIKVYVNGLLLKQNDNCANTSLKNSSEPLNIGRETSELKRYFKGVIDDVRIYNRSLNITEVNELYRIDTMDLSNGLVAHYEFENNVNDSSRNGYNIVDSIQNYKDFTIGKGIHLNGILTIDSEDSNKILSSSIYTKQFSISCWVKFYSIDDNYNEIINNVNGNDDYSFELVRVRSGYTTFKNKLIFQVKNEKQTYTVSSKNEIKSNTNYFCTVSFENSQLKLYLNGELEEQTTIEGTISELSNPIHIGSAKGIVANFDVKLNGLLDDLRIYDRALSQTEINALYSIGTSQINYNIIDQNTETESTISLTDITAASGFSGRLYAVGGNTIYASKNSSMDKFISVCQVENNLKAIKPYYDGFVAIGDSGLFIDCEKNYDHLAYELNDIAGDSRYEVVAVGNKGIILYLDLGASDYRVIESGTNIRPDCYHF